MDTISMPEPARTSRCFLSAALFMMAMWVPMELYTCMLGNTLVGVSVL